MNIFQKQMLFGRTLGELIFGWWPVALLAVAVVWCFL